MSRKWLRTSLMTEHGAAASVSFDHRADAARPRQRGDRMSRSLHVRNGSMQALVHAHSRFGRGRGNGTGPRTATALGTGRGVGWDAAGARKEAVGSLEPPAGDLWMEPVISS